MHYVARTIKLKKAHCLLYFVNKVQKHERAFSVWLQSAKLKRARKK